MGKIQEATRYLQHANTFMPNNPNNQLALSMAMVLDKKYVEAESLVNQAMQSGVEKTNAFLILAYIQHAQGHQEKALEDYNLAQQNQSSALRQDVLFRFLYQSTRSINAE